MGENNISKVLRLYEYVFDTYGNIKLCGRESCKDLIMACNSIYSSKDFGNIDTGFMKEDDIKCLVTKFKKYDYINLSLVKPNDLWLDSIYDFKSEFDVKSDELGGFGGLDRLEPCEWIQFTKDLEDAEHKCPGYANSDQFMLVNVRLRRVLGLIQVRRELSTEVLKNYGGHIGYSIRKSDRLKGYGEYMLSLALKHCKSIGIEKVMVTCNVDNIGSRKMIIGNGGKFSRRVIWEERSEEIEIYWINI